MKQTIKLKDGSFAPQEAIASTKTRILEAHSLADEGSTYEASMHEASSDEACPNAASERELSEDENMDILVANTKKRSRLIAPLPVRATSEGKWKITNNTSCVAENIIRKQEKKENKLIKELHATIAGLREENKLQREEMSRMSAAIEQLSNNLNQSTVKPVEIEAKTSKLEGKKQEQKNNTNLLTPIKPFSIIFDPVQKQISDLTGVVARLAELIDTKVASKSNEPTPAEARTFAAVAAKAPAKKLPFSKAKLIKVHSLMAPRPPPLEFSKIWIKITRSDLIKSCKNSTEVTGMLREALKSMKIHSEVVQFSKIGNSILEIYVVSEKLDWVLSNLKKCGSVVVPHCAAHIVPEYGVNPNAHQMAIQRLAWLYSKNLNRNLRACIVAGESIETINAVMAVVQRKQEMSNVNICGPGVTYHDEDSSIPAELPGFSTQKENIATNLAVEDVADMDVDFESSSGTSVSVSPSGDAGTVVPNHQ